MYTYNFFYNKTFKIAPTCFDPKIIFRELKYSLQKSIFLIGEFVFKRDFSKEQCSSLKMILGLKHVGALLNVLCKKMLCMCISWCAN